MKTFFLEEFFVWYENALLTVPLTLISGAAIAWVVSWFNARKSKVESTSAQDALTAKLLALETQGRITEQERMNAVKLAEQTAQALVLMSEKQDALSLVVDETHKNTNSAKVQMEKLEMDLRAQLDAANIANRSAAEVHVTAMQTVKDLVALEIKGKDAKIDELQRQINTLALSVPTSQPIAAMPTVSAPVIVTP